jgi:hypothetical protein
MLSDMGWWVKDRKGSAVDGGVCFWSLGNGIGVWGGKAKELDLVWRKLSEESCSKWIVENDCEEKKARGIEVTIGQLAWPREGTRESC